jgi:hypothetical protein
VLGDAAIAAWLWHALTRFMGIEAALWPRILGPVAAAPLLSLAFRMNRFRPNGHLVLIAKALGFGASLAGLVALAGAARLLQVTAGQALWFGAACAGLAWLQRSVYFGAWAGGPARPAEILRWVAVGTAATMVMLPFYRDALIGGGDGYWYAIMLSDFIAQLRSGVFPVWVGQSVYAFNGAVSPLRYAPGFQYFGGCIDLLCAHALEPIAVRNACLAVASMLGAYSAYACLRPILIRLPWAACALAMLWISSPAIWAPVIIGDQYMTFMTIPFLPLVLHGCWRVWEIDDRWARLWIAVGLAGTWLCHSPIALWMTVIAGGIYLPTIVIRRSWARQAIHLAFMAVAFGALGSLPFISVLTLDNHISFKGSRQQTIQAISSFFPGNFRPFDATNILNASGYQLGYGLLGAFALSLLLLFRQRPRGAWAFALASLLVLPSFLPFPWLTNAIWMHVPQVVVDIENSWPMLRMFPVWSALVVFVVAIVFGSSGVRVPAWQRATLLAALLCGGIWSGYEAFKVIPRIEGSATSPAQTRIALSPDNVRLTRYAYASFEYAPGYFSHGYMEPYLENRLIDRNSQDPILENSDAAAPAPQAVSARESSSRLVQSGQMNAVCITESAYYHLVPNLILDPGKHYGLRLEFLVPGQQGIMELLHPSMFREYDLPDSGVGIARGGSSPSLAFGTDATNSHVVPLTIAGSLPSSPEVLLILNRHTTESFPFARYWLYAYERGKLPIDVQSWIPYRASVVASKPAYLETPRMWIGGWRARVNGRPVPTLRSRENLVMVAVEAGPNEVVLDYDPPTILTLSFWLAVAGWMGLGGAGLVQLALWSGGNRLRFGGTC